MSGAVLPDCIRARWPELQSFRLSGTGGELLVTGQVTDIENDRSGIWMDLGGVEIAGRLVWLDRPVNAFIPADVFSEEQGIQ